MTTSGFNGSKNANNKMYNAILIQSRLPIEMVGEILSFINIDGYRWETSVGEDEFDNPFHIKIKYIQEQPIYEHLKDVMDCMMGHDSWGRCETGESEMPGWIRHAEVIRKDKKPISDVDFSYFKGYINDDWRDHFEEYELQFNKSFFTNCYMCEDAYKPIKRSPKKFNFQYCYKCYEKWLEDNNRTGRRTGRRPRYFQEPSILGRGICLIKL